MKYKGLPGYEHLSEEDQLKEMQAMFRRVFSGEEGEIVLDILLEELYFYKPCLTEEQRIRNNFAKELLIEKMGINEFLLITKSIKSCENNIKRESKEN